MERVVDLESELDRAMKRVRNQNLTALVNAGVPVAALAEIGSKQPPFGVARIDFQSGGIYEPSSEPHAIGAFLIPAYENNTLIDLIALRLQQPGLWKWRIGGAWALGADEILQGTSWCGFTEVELHATPIEWMAAAGKGGCILNWVDIPQIRSLSNFDRVITTNPDVAQRLERILSRPARKPKIIVRRANDRAAT